MIWNEETKTMDYTDERLTVRSTADRSVLFTGVLNMSFTFNFSPDALKENNSVECSMTGLAEQKYYPFHILGSASEQCKEQYDRVCEEKSVFISLDNFSHHTFSFEKTNGDVLFTARLLKNRPKDWKETYTGSRRRCPPYDLRPHEITQGAGYADSIYLHPIKQLIAGGIKNEGNRSLTCDLQDWYYLLEEYIEVGKLTYPDGRVVTIENPIESHRCNDRKLYRPGTIERDCVELSGKKIWYVVDYAKGGTDEKFNATIIFESDYAENALLKFEGTFTRQSIVRQEKVLGKIRGYVAYYQIKGVIATVGRDGCEVFENINLYSDERTMEEIAVSPSILDSFSILDGFHCFSANQSIKKAVKPIGLDDLVGLKNVKQTFAEFKMFGEHKRKSILNSHKTEDDRDKLLNVYLNKNGKNDENTKSDDTIALHMAFLGSPGTGKSLVAERVASMLKSYGLVVTKKVPIVVVKSDLVGQHVGDTEANVRKKLDEATGGILFIDEAYSLFESGDNDFGKIALNEIMYAMEQRRNKLIVIFAGYEDELLHMLKHANPGLTSRIPWYFYFDDYSVDEMWEILVKKVENGGYRFDANDTVAIKARALDCFAILQKKLDGIKEEGKTKHYFGNGRGVRTFFQYMHIGLAVRLTNSKNEDDLRTFKLTDIVYAYNKFEKGHERLVKEKLSQIGYSNS